MKDKRLYHSVADQITKLIDDGVFPPGSRLPGERDLAERFGVSRVTVREAEIALQAVGRINIKTGSGVYVLDTGTKEREGMPDVSAFELTEARALFEAEAAALAATNISDEALAELERYVEIMAQTGGHDEEGENADRDFHRKIASSSGNAAILFLIEMMWKMRNDLEPVKKVYDSVCSEDVGARAKEHQEILDALRSHDPIAARLAMRQHFGRLLESMLQVTEEQALEDARRQADASRQRFMKSANI